MTERQLVKQRETHTPDQVNSDLTFAVLVHLGSIYQRCGMSTEAIQTYTVLIKNKVFDRAGQHDDACLLPPHLPQRDSASTLATSTLSRRSTCKPSRCTAWRSTRSPTRRSTSSLRAQCLLSA